jgi:SAM-dependent methyltransferase
MKKNDLKISWKNEEERVFIGWDFTCLNDRIIEEELPWDYRTIVHNHLKPEDVLLDMGTGGGEFLLTLNHPYDRTYVTEAYSPNIELCHNKLGSLGIHVSEVLEDDVLPYEDESMDIIINRHESYDIYEVYRVLKKGGIFITQQVGGENNLVLSNRICNSKIRFNDLKNTLKHQILEFDAAGFAIINSGEHFPEIKFLDTGALVYFAKIIEWEFIDFSVDSCFEELLKVEKEISDNGFVSSKEHRYFIEAKK